MQIYRGQRDGICTWFSYELLREKKTNGSTPKLQHFPFLSCILFCCFKPDVTVCHRRRFLSIFFTTLQVQKTHGPHNLKVDMTLCRKTQTCQIVHERMHLQKLVRISNYCKFCFNISVSFFLFKLIKYLDVKVKSLFLKL